MTKLKGKINQTLGAKGKQTLQTLLDVLKDADIEAVSSKKAGTGVINGTPITRFDIALDNGSFLSVSVKNNGDLGSILYHDRVIVDIDEKNINIKAKARSIVAIAKKEALKEVRKKSVGMESKTAKVLGSDNKEKVAELKASISKVEKEIKKLGGVVEKDSILNTGNEATDIDPWIAVKKTLADGAAGIPLAEALMQNDMVYPYITDSVVPDGFIMDNIEGDTYREFLKNSKRFTKKLKKYLNKKSQPLTDTLTLHLGFLADYDEHKIRYYPFTLELEDGQTLIGLARQYGEDMDDPLINRASKIKITYWLLNGKTINKGVFSSKAVLDDDGLMAKNIASIVNRNSKNIKGGDKAFTEILTLTKKLEALEKQRDELMKSKKTKEPKPKETKKKETPKVEEAPAPTEETPKEEAPKPSELIKIGEQILETEDLDVIVPLLEKFEADYDKDNKEEEEISNKIDKHLDEIEKKILGE